MIQRIQSIFLLLASGSVASLFSKPMSLGQVVHGEAPANSSLSDRLFSITDDMGLMILTGLVAGLFLVAVFLFKNRPLQINLARIGNLLAGGLLAYGYWLFSKAAATVQPEIINGTSTATQIGYGMGIAAPILAMALSLVAMRFIRKDEALVRSADRLR
jgi:Domain of unknown function (DUF4293)